VQRGHDQSLAPVGCHRGMELTHPNLLDDLQAGNHPD
jgi:hypothetical protein